jgi:Zn-dependent M28 family amino/carboxypeptidase
VIKLLMRQNLILKKSLWAILLLIVAVGSPWGQVHCSEEPPVLDMQIIKEHLRDHLTMLTRTIGERSVRKSENIERSAAYIQAQFEKYGLAVERQTYRYKTIPVSNVVARMKLSERPAAHYVVGAHYDSVSGTVGADDNASAVAVMLETARALQAVAGGPEITFVAFALEEPPVFGTKYMGSRVFATRARQAGLTIDGMICLEMVGYTCSEPGCQHYPFPLQFFGYPKDGTYIGIVGNVKSLGFNRSLRKRFQRNPNLPVVSLTVPFNGWMMPSVRLSDHASFWSNGYRAIMLTDSAFYRNHHYHLHSDTMETLDFDFMGELVKSLVGFFGSGALP